MLFNFGDKVQYHTKHGNIFNGMVKEDRGEGEALFIVYNCDNDWANFQNYTGCNTPREDVKLGWHVPELI